ncbi:MAG: translation initiation factor aIF-1A [Thermofilum sp.]
MSKPSGESEAPEELPLPDGQTTMLGIVQQLLGYDRVRVLCSDGKIRLCRIPGKMKKRVWVRIGDVVLVAPWDFNPERGDIIYRYMPSEVQRLERKGLLEDLKKLLE